jgi:multidrug resistance efflux pump
VLFVLDQERYKLALGTAEANVAARKAEMDMRRRQAERRGKLSEIAISNEGREDAQHTADSAAATYQQALADRGTAHLNFDRTVVRAPVNGYVTNLTLDVGQYVSVGNRIMALTVGARPPTSSPSTATPIGWKVISRKPRSQSCAGTSPSTSI